jgi:hypothetical protein
VSGLIPSNFDFHQVTGREVFMFNPDLVTEEPDEEGGDVVYYTKEECKDDDNDEEEGASSTPALDLTGLGAVAETDTPTLNSQISQKQTQPASASSAREEYGLLDQACAVDRDGDKSVASVVTVNGVEIDETLFQGEALGELGLEDLDLEDSEDDSEQENGLDEDSNEENT